MLAAPSQIASLTSEASLSFGEGGGDSLGFIPSSYPLLLVPREHHPGRMGQVQAALVVLRGAGVLLPIYALLVMHWETQHQSYFDYSLYFTLPSNPHFHWPLLPWEKVNDIQS